MLPAAYVAIVVLTWILVAMNVRAVVARFEKDRNVIRLYSYLTTLVVLASLIVAVSSIVMQKAIDAEDFLRSDMAADMPHVHHRGTV